MNKVHTVFPIIVVISLLATSVANPVKPRWKRDKTRESMGDAKAKRSAMHGMVGKDETESVEPINALYSSQPKHAKHGETNKNDKIKKDVCKATKHGNEKWQSIECSVIDQMEEALYCVNKQLALKHGVPVPNREDISILDGDILLSPHQVAELADRTKGCEGMMSGLDSKGSKTAKNKRRKREMRSDRSKRAFMKDPDDLWESATIHFTVSLSDPLSNHVAQISDGKLIGGTLLEAVNNIMSRTCLKFLWFDPSGTFPEINHLIVQGANDGCWSHVGDVGGHGQYLNLGYGCGDVDTVEHELGHAIGLWHEQSRFDRDNHVKMHYQNVIPDARHNLEKCTFYQCMHSDYPYDYGSTMHYGKYFFSIDEPNKPVMTARDPRFDTTFPTRDHLSFLDYRQINNIYCGVDEETNHASRFYKVCETNNCHNGGYMNPSNCDFCICPDYLQGSCSDGERFQGTPTPCGADLGATTEWTSVYGEGKKTDSLCVWIITSPVGSKIEYRIDSVDMYRLWEGSCQKQYIEIREGETGVLTYGNDGIVDFTNTGPRICETSVPSVFQTDRTTKSNKLVLIFKNSIWSKSSSKAFSISYRHTGSNEQIDCQYDEFTAWSTCSKSCGEGTRTKSPIIKVHPANGGMDCPPLQSEPCNSGDCPPTFDCDYSWNSWSTCSETCGGGIKERTISIISQPQNGGAACPLSPEIEDCNTDYCPCVGAACDQSIYSKYCCFNTGDEDCQQSGSEIHTSFPAYVTTLDYPNLVPYYEYCHYYLVSKDPNGKIQIKFETMNIEETYDPVDIYDGSISEENKIKKCSYNDDCIGSTFTSENNSMIIVHEQYDNFKVAGEIGFKLMVKPA